MAGERTILRGAPEAFTHFKTPERDTAPFALPRPETASSAATIRHVLIVLVDDNPADILLVREALAWNEVKSDLLVARDGDEAIKLLEEIDSKLLPCPDLVVLDLNLPRRSGFDVLERIRSTHRCDGVPVAVLSSSDAPTDKQRAQRLGASRYFKKPSNLTDFMSIGGRLKEMILPFDD
jgi:CheY-like chemotaxis protein